MKSPWTAWRLQSMQIATLRIWAILIKIMVGERTIASLCVVIPVKIERFLLQIGFILKNIPAWLLTRQTKPRVLWNRIKTYVFFFKHTTFGKETGHLQSAFYHCYILVLKLARDKGHVKARGLPAKFLLLCCTYLLKRPPAILEVRIAGCFANVIKSQSFPSSTALIFKGNTIFSMNVE